MGCKWPGMIVAYLVMDFLETGDASEDVKRQIYRLGSGSDDQPMFFLRFLGLGSSPVERLRVPKAASYGPKTRFSGWYVAKSSLVPGIMVPSLTRSLRCLTLGPGATSCCSAALLNSR